MALTPGSRIGSYEISAQIGEGGMGVVYRATDTKLKRDVAIKVLPEALAGDPERLSRLQREAEVLASLNHPGIAAIYGLEETAGSRALVMELVEGPTLADRLATGVMPMEEALKLGLQIAEALEAAHAQGIIHRDLKPANVKVTPDGRVKVLDFGLAKAFEAQQDRPELTHSPTLSLAATQQGLILGTAGYMAPEQASGLPADRRADVWSFGVVLFEMLTGTQMFTGQTTAHILAGVLRADPQWDALPGNLHPRVRLMLERCLEKDPRNRYHDIADARVDLERVLADPNGALAAPAAVAPAERRSPLPLGAAAAVLTAVVGFAAAWYVKPIEQPQVVRFDYELPDGTTFWNPGFPAVALSPDGRLVAYNTSAGIYVMSLDQLDGQVIPGTEVPVLSAGNVMFSPDGGWIGYVSTTTGQIQKVSVNGGAPVPLASLSSDFGGASWGADDRIVFAEGQAIKRVSGNGGAPEVLFEVADGAPTLPRMLPDGRTVAYCVNLGAESPQVVVRGLGVDEVRTSLAGCGADYLPSGHLVYAAVNGTLFVQPFDLGARAVGGGPVSLVEGVMNVGIPQFSASSSGSLAYLPGGVEVAQDRRLGIVNLEGGVELLEGIPPGPYSSPRLSPDGKSVAFQSTEAAPLTAATSTVFVYDLSGDTAVRRLATGGKNFHPIWTPDSRSVTFASDREGAAGIYVQPADGSSPPERLTTAEGSIEHWPDAWSPDGETLVYEVVSSGRNDTDLWMLSRAEPENTAVFVEGMNHQHHAVFSPDGRWIAYASDEGTSLTDQIYVQPFPATGATYQITSESGGYPVWTADGGSLSYRRNTTATTGETAPGLFRVEIIVGERFAWRNERRLPFEGFLIFAGMRDYDVLPDGRFVMLFPAESRATGDAQRPRINVVLDWVEEVKSRVATN